MYVNKRQRQEKLFDVILRLSRAEANSPGNREVSAARAELEGLLGEAVTPAFAARALGVSHAALSRWIASRDIRLVNDVDGRRRFPLYLLVDLRIAVDRERSAGRSHALESVLLESRESARRLRPQDLLFEPSGGDEGRSSERRSLAYHRAAARRLRRRDADLALALVKRWRGEGKIDAMYANQWEEILEGPLAQIRKALEDESAVGRDLRQNSPFAGFLSEAEREEIVAEIA